jgi:hypothetical protein
MNIISKLKKHGVQSSTKIALGMATKKLLNSYFCWIVRNAPMYSGMKFSELVEIENDLHAAGIAVHDFSPRVDNFAAFKVTNYFPPNYHSGINICGNYA